ncbi:hypothetical protein Agub_g12594, partial [Astrephomene gubernaculifera]
MHSPVLQGNITACAGLSGNAPYSQVSAGHPRSMLRDRVHGCATRPPASASNHRLSLLHGFAQALARQRRHPCRCSSQHAPTSTIIPKALGSRTALPQSRQSLQCVHQPLEGPPCSSPPLTAQNKRSGFLACQASRGSSSEGTALSGQGASSNGDGGIPHVLQSPGQNSQQEQQHQQQHQQQQQQELDVRQPEGQRQLEAAAAAGRAVDAGGPAARWPA